MNVLLVGQILAVAWVAISLWMAWVNFLLLSILLLGVGTQSSRPLSARYEAGGVLFFGMPAFRTLPCTVVHSRT